MGLCFVVGSVSYMIKLHIMKSAMTKLTLLLLLANDLPPLGTLIVGRDEECETLKEIKG